MNEDLRSGNHILIWLSVIVLVLVALAAIFIPANIPPTLPNVPTAITPRPNGWDDLVKGSGMIRNVPVGPYSSPTHPPEKWTVNELETWSRSCAPLLAIVRTGLSKQCAHPSTRSFNSLFDGYARFRELARVFRGNALYYTTIGKPKVAADSLLDCMELGIVIQRGAPIIGGLVGCTIEQTPKSDLEMLLPKLSSNELALVADRMERINAKRVPFSDILIEEGRVNAATEAETFRTGNRFAAACDWNGTWIGWPMNRPSLVDRIKHSAQFALTNKSRMLAENLAYWKALANEQRKPYTGKSRVTNPANPIGRFYSGTIVPVRCRVPLARNEATFAILQAEVALQRYLAAHGRYPTLLVDLAPAYLKSVPTDPFGLGKALKYRPMNGGKSYSLYSLGPDLQDDGGTPISDQFPGPSSPGDIIAGKLTVSP